MAVQSPPHATKQKSDVCDIGPKLARAHLEAVAPRGFVCGACVPVRDFGLLPACEDIPALVATGREPAMLPGPEESLPKGSARDRARASMTMVADRIAIRPL